MNCRICGSKTLHRLDIQSFLFPSISYDTNFHEYKNYVCNGCGVVSGQPEPAEESLRERYSTSYRQSPDALELDGKVIDTPIDMSFCVRSLKRVRNFHKIIENNKSRYHDILPTEDDTIIDFGAYSGMFLYGVSQLWKCNCIATDYNKGGIDFAKKVFGFMDSCVVKDIYTDTFSKKISYATMVHSLEHLRQPVQFLEHLRTNILDENGYLYIEVPNLYGIPLCEPLHFFTYTRESLTYLLQRSGFKVIEIFENGYPPTPQFKGYNDVQNLVCLACPIDGQATLHLPKVNFLEIRKDLRKNYLHHSRLSVVRQLKKSLREFLKFLYFFLFAVILEKFSPSLMMWAATLIRARKKSDSNH